MFKVSPHRVSVKPATRFKIIRYKATGLVSMDTSDFRYEWVYDIGSTRNPKQVLISKNGSSCVGRMFEVYRKQVAY